jgi:hypothetical protein
MSGVRDDYVSFYRRAFEKEEVDEILGKGGGSSVEDFTRISKGVMGKRDYWDAMFPRFKGRDGLARPSKLGLGRAVFERFFAQKNQVGNVVRGSYKSKGGKVVEYVRVAKGGRVVVEGRVYRAGWFLPKIFRV